MPTYRVTWTEFHQIDVQAQSEATAWEDSQELAGQKDTRIETTRRSVTELS